MIFVICYLNDMHQKRTRIERFFSQSCPTSDTERDRLCHSEETGTLKHCLCLRSMIPFVTTIALNTLLPVSDRLSKLCNQQTLVYGLRKVSRTFCADYRGTHHQQKMLIVLSTPIAWPMAQFTLCWWFWRFV